MSGSTQPPLRQRADYTHKPNLRTGRHGWLRLTPAYSVKIVEELLGQVGRPVRVFDPFCGTGTTALCAAYHGQSGTTLDINPFLVWFGQAKTAYYPPEAIAACKDAVSRVCALVGEKTITPVAPPPLHNIERWWSAKSLEFLCRLRAAIDAASEANSQERNILLIAFCRTLIALSNASFDHQSMSFKGSRQLPLQLDIDLTDLYVEDVRVVLSGAAENPAGSGQVIFGDARTASRVVDGLFDVVITSPPYANRMSYIRELRPYMYWLGFLANGRDAGELDWLSIGGTWGIATSRLNDWQPGPDHFTHDLLSSALDAIAHQGNKNGWLLATYIAKYFDDMWAHFQDLRALLSPGAELHYVVGNSTFYGTLLPVERIYAAMLESVDFHSVSCRPIRKRNSNKELIEFEVTATWPA
jgi:hypothetical protein